MELGWYMCPGIQRGWASRVAGQRWKTRTSSLIPKTTPNIYYFPLIWQILLVILGGLTHERSTCDFFWTLNDHEIGFSIFGLSGTHLYMVHLV